MPKDLTALFCPKTLAIVGASRSPEKVGAVVLKGIQEAGYAGTIYPVNPKAVEVGGLKCYPSVTDLPETPDLAIVAIPAPLVLEALAEIGEKGVPNVIVMSAGFKETGDEGAKLEKQLVELADKYQINMLGPNCMGYVNTLCSLNATFAHTPTEVGNLRLVSQSGAVAASIFDWCDSINLGFSTFITLGNKAQITETDILEFYKNQTFELDNKGLSHVRPIGLYLESVAHGTEFLKLVEAVSKTDPVLVIKPGKTSAGEHAMASHTGSMAGEDVVFETALRQAGGIRCNTLEDFFDLTKAFAWEDAPKGPKVAVVTNSGGPGVISADAVVSSGLELTPITNELKSKLLEVLPPASGLANPVDVLGDALADRYYQAAEILFENAEVDVMLFLLTPLLMTEIEQTAEAINKLSKKYHKPIFCSFIGGTEVVAGNKILDTYKIPAYNFPERAIFAISKMYEWQRNKQQHDDIVSLVDMAADIDFEISKQIVFGAIRNQQVALDNFQVNDILTSVGITVPATRPVRTLEEAQIFSAENGWPVVLKLSASGLLHKKDIGGVITSIDSFQALEESWARINEALNKLAPQMQELSAIQIQQQVPDGVEVIVGVKKDATFGNVLLFGAGGTLAELIQDRNLYVLPMEDNAVDNFVASSKIYKVLKGYRGHEAYALDKLYDLLIRFAKTAEAHTQIAEMEINPVIVTPDAVWAVDGKVVLTQQASSVPAGPKFLTAKTLEHKVLATTYHYFEFEPDVPLKYQPGQYLSVKVSSDRINCYSIAGQKGNKFNLLVDVLPGGPGSKFFESLKVGEDVSYLGPFGNFVLHEDDNAKHILLLATGCGFAPLKSILETLLVDRKTTIPISLYFGFRKPQDVFWEDYFAKLASTYPNFKYHLTVDKAEGDWCGNIGYITELINKDFEDLKGFSAYLCGSKPMINAAVELLTSKGCSEDNIYYEKL